MRLARLSRSPRAWAAALAVWAVGCTPHIGDSCTLNTDCDISNTRQCDNSEPNGYCTIFNCGPNSCPDNAACIMFLASVPGCGYDDYASPSRTGTSFCMKACQGDSDCREGDGYRCRDLSQLGVSAISLDVYPKPRVCAIPPDQPHGPGADAAVCPGGGVSPDGESGYFDGAIPQQDAGEEAGGEAGSDAGIDAPADAGSDATPPADDGSIDGGTESGADATMDSSADATVDGAALDASEAAAADAGGG